MIHHFESLKNVFWSFVLSDQFFELFWFLEPQFYESTFAIWLHANTCAATLKTSMQRSTFNASTQPRQHNTSYQQSIFNINTTRQHIHFCKPTLHIYSRSVLIIWHRNFFEKKKHVLHFKIIFFFCVFLKKLSLWVFKFVTRTSFTHRVIIQFFFLILFPMWNFVLIPRKKIVFWNSACVMTVLMCWCVDVLMCWWLCWWLVLVRWCVDVLMCWCVDVLMTVLMCWCVDVLIRWCVDVLMCWCVHVFMCSCVDVLMCWWLCWCVDALMWCVDVLMWW